MNITITDKAKYIRHCDVKNYLALDTNKIEKELFGKKVILGDNPWLWHVHIKMCEYCSANCKFCIEQNSHRILNEPKVLENTNKLLTAMKEQGILHSVSVTGGEPTEVPFMLYKLCGILREQPIQFLTMNTNGIGLSARVIQKNIDGLFHFIDVSRHAIDDEANFEIFHSDLVPTLDDLKKLKEVFTETKMRIQCVMFDDMGIEEFLRTLEAYRFADNISFRRLMSPTADFDAYKDTHDYAYFRILDWVYETGTFIEQTIQDYYVYEIWEVDGVNITFSYSDMHSLEDVESKEDPSIIREFVVHPDGVVSGSWIEGNKVLLT